ncbi:MAG: hypothetical protein U0572_12195 [Phycisphaerales bacterium]
MNRWTRWRPVAANFAVVTLVSLVLWLWAAGRSRETTTVGLSVRFVVADTDRLLAVPVDPISVDVELQGSRRELDRAAERLSGKTIPLRVGRVGVPSALGTHSIDLTLAIGRAQEINEAGVAVVSTSPSTTTLELVETESVDAKIVLVVPGYQIAGQTVAEPSTARVTLPKSLVPALGNPPQIEAFVTPQQASTLMPGRRRPIDATLRVPPALDAQSKLVRIAPDKARMTFTLASRSSTTTLRLVPVQIAGPPADIDGYTIAIEPSDAFLRDVEVTGPSETIRALEDGRANVFAFVHLSADDLALRVTRKRVDLWMLPPEVTVLRVGESVDTQPLIRLSIAQRPVATRE